MSDHRVKHATPRTGKADLERLSVMCNWGKTYFFSGFEHNGTSSKSRERLLGTTSMNHPNPTLIPSFNYLKIVQLLTDRLIEVTNQARRKTVGLKRLFLFFVPCPYCKWPRIKASVKCPKRQNGNVCSK